MPRETETRRAWRLLALATVCAGCGPDRHRVSREMLDFLDGREYQAHTKLFPREQVVVSKGVCVVNEGRRDRWFGIGDDGFQSFRTHHCPRQTYVHNGTAGELVGTKRGGPVYRTVVPGRLQHSGQRWKLYKRCGGLAPNGRPHTSSHVEFRPGGSVYEKLARTEAVWIETPLILASDLLRNVGHALRDMLLINALAREWRCSRPKSPLNYMLLDIGRNPKPPLPWVESFSTAIATSRGITHFATAPGQTYCFDAVIQKAAQVVGDAEDARAMRNDVLDYCQVERNWRDSLVYVIHGESTTGSRDLSNSRQVKEALGEIARDFELELEVVELGKLSFCEQVAVAHRARMLVGVFGAAIGGNFLATNDDALTVELTACPSSTNRSLEAQNLGHTFQPMAAALAKGYMSFCLCIADSSTDLDKRRTSSLDGWFHSTELTINVPLFTKTLRLALHGDFQGASSTVLKGNPCRYDESPMHDNFNVGPDGELRRLQDVDLP